MKYFALIVLLISVSATPSFAWHINTHVQMTRDAVALMPADLQKFFQEHQRFVEMGIKDPDELIKDWQNHYYIPQIPEGGGLDRIEKIIKTVQSKFKAGTPTEQSKQLCYLAHYIADLWNPENLIKAPTASNQRFIENNTIIVLFEGYDGPITSYREYLQKRSEWRWRLENSPQIETLLYSEAVNDIARVWLSLYQESGRDLGLPIAASRINHERGALSINFERLLREEKLYWHSARGENNIIDAMDAHEKEMARLSDAAGPSDATLVAQAEMRNNQEWMGRVNPNAPFKMMETSLKSIGDQTYFVARVQNKSEGDIPSIAFMYPGVKGPAALVQNLKAGDVVKIEAVLPAGATKEQVQLIFASPQQE